MLNNSITTRSIRERLYAKPRQNPDNRFSEHQRIPRTSDE
jgi:hypothetical protein